MDPMDIDGPWHHGTPRLGDEGISPLGNEAPPQTCSWLRSSPSLRDLRGAHMFQRPKATEGHHDLKLKVKLQFSHVVTAAGWWLVVSNGFKSCQEYNGTTVVTTLSESSSQSGWEMGHVLNNGPFSWGLQAQQQGRPS